MSFDWPGRGQVPILGAGRLKSSSAKPLDLRVRKGVWFLKSQELLGRQKHRVTFICLFSTTQSWMKGILAAMAQVSVKANTCWGIALLIGLKSLLSVLSPFVLLL